MKITDQVGIKPVYHNFSNDIGEVVDNWSSVLLKIFLNPTSSPIGRELEKVGLKTTVTACEQGGWQWRRELGIATDKEDI